MAEARREEIAKEKVTKGFRAGVKHMFKRIKTRIGLSKDEDPDELKSSFGFEEAHDRMADFATT